MATPYEKNFNRKLALEVQKHECLYKKLTKYSSKVTREAWTKIASNLQEFNIDGGECEAKWKNLKSHFLKAKNCGEEHYLDKEMSFLLPHTKEIKKRSTQLNILIPLLFQRQSEGSASDGVRVDPSNDPQCSSNTRGTSSQGNPTLRSPRTSEEGEGIPDNKRRKMDGDNHMKDSEPKQEKDQFMEQLNQIVNAMDAEQYKTFCFQVKEILQQFL